MIDAFQPQPTSAIEQTAQRNIFLANENEKIANEIVELVGRLEKLLAELDRNCGRRQSVDLAAWPPRRQKVANTSQQTAVAS
jgi:hypothetical protein